MKVYYTEVYNSCKLLSYTSKVNRSQVSCSTSYMRRDGIGHVVHTIYTARFLCAKIDTSLGFVLSVIAGCTVDQD